MLVQYEDVIMKQKEVKTKIQTAIIKEFYCFAKKINLSTDKTSITSDGSDSTIIVCQWQKFNIENNAYVDDVKNNEPIKLEVNGKCILLDDVTNGRSGIDFSSLEIGQHVIRSVNENVENTELVVTAE